MQLEVKFVVVGREFLLVERQVISGKIPRGIMANADGSRGIDL